MFELLRGKPLAYWALQTLNSCSLINEIILVINSKSKQKAQELVRIENLSKVKEFIIGGEQRQDSVYAGLQAVSPEMEQIIVHDGARPNLKNYLVADVLNLLQKYDGIVPAVDSKDTIKRVENDKVTDTLDRKELKMVQTPQAFKKSAIESAHKLAKKDKLYGTDDAFLLEKYGFNVGTVNGDDTNFKITTKSDLRLMEMIMKESGECRE